MQEAMTLFESVANSRWFIKTSIILFLNKIDLFRAKLPVSPLANTFPEYRGGADYDQACAFLLEKFVGLNQNPSKSIYAVSLPKRCRMSHAQSPLVLSLSLSSLTLFHSTTPTRQIPVRSLSLSVLSTTLLSKVSGNRVEWRGCRGTAHRKVLGVPKPPPSRDQFMCGGTFSVCLARALLCLC